MADRVDEDAYMLAARLKNVPRRVRASRPVCVILNISYVNRDIRKRWEAGDAGRAVYSPRFRQHLSVEPAETDCVLGLAALELHDAAELAVRIS
ncbi:MAG: hypothetical protein QM736_28615 [Vicinamibacterales bacterium]